jgi:hypothetical protein
MRKFVCVSVPAVACLLGGRERERVLFIGTQFSILYTSMCRVLLGGREGKFKSSSVDVKGSSWLKHGALIAM